MTQRTELPELTAEQMAVLSRFARLEVGLEEVRTALTGIFEFDLDPGHRTASTRFKLPEPGIAITRDHIFNALELKRLGVLSEQDLVYWATMLLLNNAYEPDPQEEEFVAEWLNDISYNLNAS
jgi:hypothetical protein